MSGGLHKFICETERVRSPHSSDEPYPENHAQQSSPKKSNTSQQFLADPTPHQSKTSFSEEAKPSEQPSTEATAHQSHPPEPPSSQPQENYPPPPPLCSMYRDGEERVTHKLQLLIPRGIFKIAVACRIFFGVAIYKLIQACSSFTT